MADAGNAADYSPVEVIFSPEPGFQMLFDGMNADQELGRPFLIQVEMSSGEPDTGSKVQKLIGSTCCIWMYDADAKDGEPKNRYLHGVVTRAISAGLEGGAYRYKFEVRPWIWLLSQHVDCRIFQKMKVVDIIQKVFRDGGFSDFEANLQGGSGDTELEYCVQYRETSLAFVTRLMEQFGIYYYHKFERTKHTLVLVDDTNAHEVVSAEIPFTFDQTEYRTVTDHMYVWSTDLHLNSGRWAFNDYNMETPAADLMAKTVKDEENQYGKFEVYEYPGPYTDHSEGQRLSDVRMQAITRERQVSSGQSNSRKLLCGWRFKLKEHLDTSNNREHLIIHSISTMTGAEGTPNERADTIDTYQSTMTCIPSDVPFRLKRITPRPMIRGPQTAKVVGASGDEITTDEHGRIKVKFHWDRASVQDEDRTCWIRVSQSWASGNWGAITIPRVGQEVIVEFLEGNPDRPLVTGVVYNGNNKAPNPLPANKTQTILRSNSSPGGSGFNELRFEDKAGEEELYLHAQKDYKRDVLNNETVKIKQDRTHTIESGNDSLTVSTGNHTITISAGTSEISAKTSITLKVGSNKIEITNSGITITGATLSLEGKGTADLKSSGATTVKGSVVSIN